jgi:hypothetical protein
MIFPRAGQEIGDEGMQPHVPIVLRIAEAPLSLISNSLFIASRCRLCA